MGLVRIRVEQGRLRDPRVIAVERIDVAVNVRGLTSQLDAGDERVSREAGAEARREVDLIVKIGLDAGAARRIASDQDASKRLARAWGTRAEIRRVELIIELIVRIAQRIGDRQLCIEFMGVTTRKNVVI